MSPSARAVPRRSMRAFSGFPRPRRQRACKGPKASLSGSRINCANHSRRTAGSPKMRSNSGSSVVISSSVSVYIENDDGNRGVIWHGESSLSGGSEAPRSQWCAVPGRSLNGRPSLAGAHHCSPCRAQVHLEGPGAARLPVQLPIGLGDVVGRRMPSGKRAANISGKSAAVVGLSIRPSRMTWATCTPSGRARAPCLRQRPQRVFSACECGKTSASAQASPRHR